MGGSLSMKTRRIARTDTGKHGTTKGRVGERPIKKISMSNRTSTKSAQEIADLLQIMRSVLETSKGAPYHLDQATIAGLQDAENAVRGGIASTDNLLALYREAVRDKEAARTDAIRAIGRLAAKLYNDPTVTPAMIAALGLAPRLAPGRPVAPTPVTGVQVVPNVDGTAKVSFKKGTNRTSTLYDVQVSEDGQTWETAAITLKASERIEGCPPGEARWFRVVARNSVGVAAPSASAAIYAPVVPAPVTLKLAA